MIGLPQNATTWQELDHYMVAGRMPDPNAVTMEIVVGLARLGSMVPQEERDLMRSWPPTADDLRTLRFEITAGVVQQGGLNKDIVRVPARVVGVFETRIDLVDSFSAWADIDRAAALSDAQMPVANAFTARGDVPASNEDFVTQSPSAFTAKYVGALFLVIQILAQVCVGLLLVAPLFLVWNNLQQVLDRYRRELVVCRAMGVQGPIPRALFRLAARATAWGLLSAAVLTGVLQLVLPPVFERWSWLPVPATWQVDVVSAVILAGLVILGTLSAVVAAWIAYRREDLASTLRAS